jgi:hypothetical protein
MAFGYGGAAHDSGRPVAMVKLGTPKLDKKFFEGWLFVIVAGLVLAVIAIINSGGMAQTTVAPADGSSGCQLEVTTDRLNVRASPSQDGPLLRTLSRGDVVDGTRIQNNFYRQLEDGGWAATEFLTPLPGSNCA